MSRFVFLLGSGFSKDIAGLPLLSELSVRIQRQLDDVDDLTSTSRWIAKRVPRSVTGNVETLLTYLHVPQPWWSPEDTALARAAYHWVVAQIREDINDQWRMDDPPSVSAEAIGLVQEWHRRNSWVVTFNYDTITETIAATSCRVKKKNTQVKHPALRSLRSLEVLAAEDLHPPVNREVPYLTYDESSGELSVVVRRNEKSIRGVINDFASQNSITSDFSKVTTSNVTSLIRSLNKPVSFQHLYQLPLVNVRGRTAALLAPAHTETLRLLKLHGSTNWFHSGRSDTVGEQLYYDHRKAADNVRDVYASEMGIRDLVPYIVPPILDKTSLYSHNAMRAQWRMAWNAIADASHLCVVGYSMPPTDLATEFLLRDGLRESEASVAVFTMSKPRAEEQLRRRFLDLVDGNPNRLELINASSADSSVRRVTEWLKTR